MATPTTLKLGAYDFRLDSFISHSANPNNAIVDLNDGSTLTLADDPDGLGRGFDWGIPQRDHARSGNMRTRGERLTRQGYYHNRTMVVHLYWGPGSSYAAWIAAIQNLIATCEGITNTSPGALQIVPVGSSTSVYADVLSAQVVLPYEELSWLQRQSDSVTLVLECAPLLRGAMTTLDNLAWNGGFEGPSGPSVAVFADTFANFNFYSTQAGATPTVTGFTGFYDAVVSDSPTRYYRLDEASGTVAYDTMASGNNGTYTAGVTLGTTGLCTGDGDKAITLNGTTGDVSLGTTGLPTGNGAWSVACICQIAGAPAGNVSLFSMGSTSGVRTAVWVQITNTRTVQIVTSSTGVVCTSAAISTGAPHLVVATWDGTTARLYIDNAAAVTGTPGALALTYTSGGFLWGANYNTGTPSQFYGGILDEAAIYTAATLSAARVTAYYTAMTTTPTNLTNTMLLPSGSRVAFGSPSWGAINQWILRFEPQAGGTLTCYLHYTDANNYLAVTVANRATLAITHVIAGSSHTLASVSVTLNSLWYWLRITQFPQPAVSGSNVPPGVIATLYNDSSGTVGSAVNNTGTVAAFDSATALSGRPQIAATGIAFTLGGNFSSVHTVSLFGPGAWQLVATSGTPTLASGAWEQDTSNTYPNGPVTSYGAARIDAPPATVTSWDVVWRTYLGGSPNGVWTLPATTGEVLGISAWVKSTSTSATSSMSLAIREYDSSGVLQRTGVAGSAVAGNAVANWTQIGGTYTIGASTAYIDVGCRALDTTANSHDATFWFDNLLCWSQTTTGVSQMPYCETRFPQSPAQIVVSGIQGDLPTPAAVALGTNMASWTMGATLNYALGRRGQFSKAGRMVGRPHVILNTAPGAGTLPVLSSTAYGGYWISDLSGLVQPFGISNLPSDMKGVFHILALGYSAETAPTNIAKVGFRAINEQRPAPWVPNSSSPNGGFDYAAILGSLFFPLSAQNTWTLVDGGTLNIPPVAQGALVDNTASWMLSYIRSGDTNVSILEVRMGWQALLPTDAELLAGVVNNPSGSGRILDNTSWLWLYLDSLLGNRNTLYDTASALYSVESKPLPAPRSGAGGPGSQASATINVNQTGSTTLYLDPALGASGGQGGVNQFMGVLTDNAGAVLPLIAQIRYVPNYTYP